MSRAYICLLRNDLDENLLQVLDLKPNSSLRVPSLEPAGQTEYLTHYYQSDDVALTTNTEDYTVAAYKGLAAYYLDNVDVGGVVLTESQANFLAVYTTSVVFFGKSFAIPAFDSVFFADLFTNLLTTPVDLDGTQVMGSNSTGKVEDVFRILSGEVFYLPAGSQVSGAAHAFQNPHAGHGFFLDEVAVGRTGCAGVQVNDVLQIGGLTFTAKASEDIAALQFSQAVSDELTAISLANVINDHRTQEKFGKVFGDGVAVKAKAEGRKVHLFATKPGVVGQKALASSTSARLPLASSALVFVPGAFRPFRKIVSTGALIQSGLTGAISKLADANFKWINPAFTYGDDGNAYTVFPVMGPIPTDGVCPAVIVVDSEGNIIG